MNKREVMFPKPTLLPFFRTLLLVQLLVLPTFHCCCSSMNILRFQQEYIHNQQQLQNRHFICKHDRLLVFQLFITGNKQRQPSRDFARVGKCGERKVMPETRMRKFLFPQSQSRNFVVKKNAIHTSVYSNTLPASNTSTVSGLQCVHVTINLPYVGKVTVLEASAQSQELLVNLALEQEDDKETTSMNTRSMQGNEQNNTDATVKQIKEQLSLPTGDPYGSVLWPASSAMASYLLTKQTINKEPFLNSKKLLIEIGAGTGLISIALACTNIDNTTNVQSVLATDYEKIPLQLLLHSAKFLNSHNCRHEIIDTTYFDICDFNTTIDSLVARMIPVISTNHSNTSACSSFDPSDVIVVASDIMYEPRTGKAMASRAIEALQAGYYVFIGDSPGRAGRPAFIQELERQYRNIVLYGNNKRQGSSCRTNKRKTALPSLPTFQMVQGYTVTGDRNELICGYNSESWSSNGQEQLPIRVAILELDPTRIVLRK